MEAVTAIVPELPTTSVTSTGDMLEEIYELCGKIKDGKELWVRVHERLSDIRELQKKEAKNQLPPSEVSDRYVEMLRKSLECMKTHMENSTVSGTSRQREKMDDVRVLHEEIDKLVATFNLPATSIMMQWKEEWERERADKVSTQARVEMNGATVQSTQEATLPVETHDVAKKMLEEANETAVTDATPQSDRSHVIDTQPVEAETQLGQQLPETMARLSISSLCLMLDSCEPQKLSVALEEVTARATKSVKNLPHIVKRGVDKWVNELVHSSTSEELVARCKILNEIADVNEAHHGTIIQAGAVPFLAKWARDDKAEDVKAIASSILKCLMTCSYRSHVVEALLTLVQSTTSESDRLDGLRGIELSVSTEALSGLIKSNGVSVLFKLIESGSDEEKSRAVSTLHDIVMTKDVYIETIRQAAWQADGVAVLNTIAQSHDSDLQAKAVWMIGALTRRHSITRQHPANLSIVPILVEMATTGDEKKKESAAFTLGSLMKSDAVKQAVRENGGLGALHKLAESGSPDQVKNAQRALAIAGECCIS